MSSPRQRETARRYYWANRERIRQYSRGYYAANRKAIYLKQKARMQAYKAQAFAGYGDKCACCGLTDSRFFTLDHINNDGAADRKRGSGGTWGFYKWVIDKNFPKHIQILCWNCNCAKHVFGKCPHQMDRELEAQLV